MSLNVLMISPGYPAEMPYFTRALSLVGARVVGLGDQPSQALPQMAREHLSHHLQVPSLWDEAAVIREVQHFSRHARIDRVECLWEPGMILAAKLREALGVPGLGVDQTVPFRDKEIMKQRLDAAGIRTPRHHRALTANQVREAAERIGYPVIVKPIAGAGSADTYRCDTREDLERSLLLLQHVPEVSVEEFVDGEEFTFDTICAEGELYFENVCWYRPRPLVMRLNEWVSPQTVAVRNLDQPDLVDGRRMGREVLRALGFRTGFTHMEWYRKQDGEVVFGEIGGRPPGARTVDVMNWCTDNDTYVGWAEAVCFGRVERRFERKWNVVNTFKRAQGRGRIRRIEGLDRFLAECRPWIIACELAPVGAPKADWRNSIVADGYVAVRHTELGPAVELGDRVAREIHLYAS